MATYKKKGYKKSHTGSRKEGGASSAELESTTAGVFNTLDETANRAELWLAKRQRPIIITIGLIAVVVLSFLGFQKYIQEPNEAEALSEMHKAQSLFDLGVNLNATDRDSIFNLALNGSEGKYGFLDIIDNYSSTPAGNLARYYAGMAYLNMNKYQEAIEHLDEFSSPGDDLMLGPLAKGGIGDAFAQLDQHKEALKYYKDAERMRTNDFTTPQFLLKAAITAIKLNESKEALSFLKQIETKFPNTPEAKRAEIYIGMAEAMQ